MTTLKKTVKRKYVEENRKFNDEWELKYFFIFKNEKPLCLICRENLSNIKECNLKRHFMTLHSVYATFAKEIKEVKLKALKEELSSQQNIFRKFTFQPKSIVKASYCISNIIAKRMKPFSDGEFVKECIEAAVECLCPDKKQLFSDVSLSRRTVTRRVEDISKNILKTLQSKIARFVFYSICIDESCDLMDTAQLCIFIRGVDCDFNVTEEFLNMKSMEGKTTGKDILQEVLTSIKDNNMKLSSLAGITTDGAPSMVGRNNGVVSLLKKEMIAHGLSPDIFVFHCLIHQENLCAKALNMKHVMSVVVKTVNYIRNNALKHRKFKEFLKSIDSEYGDVIYFSEVRWLSRADCLKKFFELRHEINTFMCAESKNVVELTDEQWTLDLAFVVDICNHLNVLNMKLQGENVLITCVFSYLKAFKEKLRLWERQFKKEEIIHFPCLKTIAPEINHTKINFQKYAEEIQLLIDEFDSRFSEINKYNKLLELFTSPFNVEVNSVPEKYQLELIDLQCNTELKNLFFATEDIAYFYKKFLKEEVYKNLREHALKVVSIFGSTYRCEAFFSKLTFVKSKMRTNLTNQNLENELRVAASNITADLEHLSNEVEHQKSH